MKKLRINRKNKKGFQKFAAGVMVLVMTVSGLTIPSVRSEAAAAEYEIYPNPQVIQYTEGDYVIKNEVNVVYESGIDQATKDRLAEALALKDGVTVTTSESIEEGKTNILVGIDGSGEVADTYADEHVNMQSADLYEKLDAYVLDSNNDVITVVGADTDASYYGLTTLYHILKQMDSNTIRNFHIEDWADVASRGFIEGYYGNPWSTEDRINLMKWGGYYKLNSYFYAPKNDPKHNAKWRELYTEEELNTLIRPLAEAGNASKCRFVYALHTFMYNPVRFDSNYQADLKAVQDKLAQVIEAGVRQVAILADDAGNVGGDNYNKFLTDMTAWLAEMKKTYPDLKQTLPFCPQEYMYNGQGYYKNFPENVQIVMTGGKVWGEVNQNFTNTFTNNAGRGPYMWINWPCTDNSKNHLIMGGYTTFLHPGVDPAKIQGIVLNPMQQSEPSKVAIFGNACYSWNIWENADIANKAWQDSFKYVDHNSAVETEASTALYELSKHMMNQNMDNRVTALQESVELAPKLTAFRDKLKTGTVTVEEADALIAEFQILQNAAAVYREQAVDTKVRDQIVYWLDCWDDTTVSAIGYLNAIKAIINEEADTALRYNAEAKAAFEQSKTHELWYLDHYEKAEVGVQHIVPFIKAMAKYVTDYIDTGINPNTQERYTGTVTYNQISIQNNATEDRYFDRDDSSEVWLARGPYEGSGRDTIPAGATLTVTFPEPKTIGSFRLVQGVSATGDKFSNADVEYQIEGTSTWTKAGTLSDKGDQTVSFGNVANVKAVRIHNKTVTGGWVRIGEIEILSPANEDARPIEYNIIRTNRWTVADSEHIESKLYDGDDNSYVWYDPDGSGNTTNDTCKENDYLGYDFGKVADLSSAHIVVGADNGDKLKRYKIETSLDGDKWTPVDGYDNYTGVDSGKDILNIDLTGTRARYIRICNLEDRQKWVKFSEFTVKEKASGARAGLYTNVDTNITASLEEGSVSLSNGTVTLNKDEYIGVKLGDIKAIQNITVPELPGNVVLETSMNEITWQPYAADAKNVDAAYIRIRNNGEEAKEITLNDFAVTYKFVGAKKVDTNFEKAQNENDMRVAGTVGNVFDGKLSTLGMINGKQEAGKHITFDLGQVIHFNSLRYYIVETQLNYLRNAKFEVSTDGTNWTEVMTVGKPTQNVHDNTVAKDMQGITLTHDDKNPGYMYKEAKGLDVDGRYIRIMPKETYNHRWVAINELQINGGEYISSEQSRQIVSDAIEEAGKIPSNMRDGSYGTTYKSSKKNSSITWRVLDPTSIASVRLIQIGDISKADVTATYLDKSNVTKASKEVKLGKLNQVINEFVIPEGKMLETLTVTWKDVIPEIAEIETSSERGGEVNKETLKAELAKAEDDTWTTDSKTAYTQAKETAQEIYDNENASQAMVDSAIKALESARTNAKIKANEETVAKMKKMLAGKISNEETIYTKVTYSAYENLIGKLEKAMKTPDNLSQTDADELMKNVTEAQNNLVYSTRNRELAELEAEKYDLVEADQYTKASHQALTAIKSEIDTLVAKDKEAEIDGTERVNPKEFIAKRTAFQNRMSNLVDISALKAAIKQSESVDGSLYTKESYQSYVAAVEAGKQLLDAGTKEQVAEALKLIEEKYNGLTASEKVTLEQMIQAAKALKAESYTEDSYQELMNIVAEAEKSGDDKYIDKIQEAMKKLVNVEALKDKIQAAEKVDKKLYTEDSYQRLEDALKKAKKLLKSGSAKEVKAATEELENARRALVRKTTVDVEGNQNNAGQNTDQKGQAVQTGDEGNLLPIVLVMVACIAIIAVVIIRGKRK